MQNIMRKMICVLMSFHLWSVSPAMAEELQAAFGNNYAPYFIKELNDGIELRILRGALEPAGFTVSGNSVIYERAVSLYQSGQIDFITVSSPNNKMDGCTSDQFISYQNVAITKANANLRLNSVKDLSTNAVVSFQGASVFLGDEYALNTGQNPDYRELKSQTQQISMLLMGRADVVVMDRLLFEWNLLELEIVDRRYPTTEFTYHYIFPSTPGYLIFKNEAICQQFNQGLRALMETGRYDDYFQFTDDLLPANRN